MTSTTAIEIAGLTKSYGDHVVLRGLDLRVPSGTIFALLGSNGAGKTTAVRILSTLLKADGGTATVDGHDVATEPDARARVDQPHRAVRRRRRDPHRTREPRARRRSCDASTDPARDRRRPAGAVRPRPTAAGKRVATYSGGMRRRLDIAMSLIGDPPVLFLDEPTTGLDPQSRIEVWRTVRELAGQGTTVLLTTQYLEEAEQLADRIAILHEGRIIADGTLAELKQLFPPARSSTSRSSRPSKTSSSRSSATTAPTHPKERQR